MEYEHFADRLILEDSAKNVHSKLILNPKIEIEYCNASLFRELLIKSDLSFMFEKANHFWEYLLSHPGPRTIHRFITHHSADVMGNKTHQSDSIPKLTN